MATKSLTSVSKTEFPITTENPIDNPGRWQFYTRTVHGGRNRCIQGYHQYGNNICSALTNCVGYCFGRADETWGDSWTERGAVWPTSGPWSWYYASPASYHITRPTAGCVAAFNGHVLFVEKIWDDGQHWDYSESWYSSLKGGKPMFYQYVSGAAIGTYYGRERYGYIIPPNVKFQTIAQDHFYTFNAEVDSRGIPKKEWR